MKRSLFVLLLLLCGTRMPGATPPEPFQLTPDGKILAAACDLSIRSSCFGSNWKQYGPGELRDCKLQGDCFSGNWEIDGTRVSCTSVLEKRSTDTFRLRMTAVSEKPLKVQYFFAGVIFPVNGKLTLDGVRKELPASYERVELYQFIQAKDIRIYTQDRCISIAGDRNFTLIITDNRPWNQSSFTIRILFAGAPGNPLQCGLDLQLKQTMQQSQPLDLRSVMNRGFQDDPDAAVRGWTGQGGGNDLRGMKPQKISCGHIDFNVVDPAENRGRGAIVLAGKNRLQQVPEQIDIPVPDDFPVYGAVNFLHAAAWPQKKIGIIDVRYADGTNQTVDVDSNAVGNWWEPQARSNGIIVWEGENPAQRVGLYASSFPLKAQKVKSLTLKMTNPESMWMIPAITFSQLPIFGDSVILRDVKRVDSARWLPMKFSRDTLAGSPLDFSTREAPAGKYGRVIVAKNGHLAFEKMPEKSIRLFGVNLCFNACAPDHRTAERLADELCKTGYNSVRLHHIDNGALLKDGLNVSTELDPVKMERFDYFLAQLKKRGLYVTLDFYSSREIKPGDDVPDNGRNYKALVIISREARNNLKLYIRNLMTHRNPYTGMPLAEDPVLCAVNLVNEDYVVGTWSQSPYTASRFKTEFQNWCARNRIEHAKAEDTDPDFYRFLLERQAAATTDLTRFVREELHCPTLVSDANAAVSPWSVRLVRNFDFVDNHMYHDHPSFPEKAWSLPSAFRQDSCLDSFCRFPLLLATTRIFGKPFFVTEYNICYPNAFRAECGPLAGAVAALQDWDAIYRFAWSHGIGKLTDENAGIEGFDICNDPIGFLTERIAWALFLRGDMKPAPMKIARETSDRDFRQKDGNFQSSEFEKLGLIAQIGRGEKNDVATLTLRRSDISPKNVPDRKTATEWSNLLSWRKAVSVTDQLVFEPREKRFSVVTPKTEAFVLRSGDAARGQIMTVGKVSCFAVVALISLDDLPLQESKDMLLLHLTNVNSSETVFGSPQMTILRSTGRAPQLVYRGDAEIGIRSRVPFSVDALTAGGEKIGKVEGRCRDGVFQFKADTGCFPGGVMAYHLRR